MTTTTNFRDDDKKGRVGEIFFNAFAKENFSNDKMYFVHKNILEMAEESENPFELTMKTNPFGDKVEQKDKNDNGVDFVCFVGDNKINIDVKNNYQGAGIFEKDGKSFPYDNVILEHISMMDPKSKQIKEEGSFGFPDSMKEDLKKNPDFKENTKETEIFVFVKIPREGEFKEKTDGLSMVIVEKSNDLKEHLKDLGYYKEGSFRQAINKDVTNGLYGDKWTGAYLKGRMKDIQGYCLKIDNGRLDLKNTDFSKASSSFQSICSKIKFAMLEKNKLMSEETKKEVSEVKEDLER